VWSAAMVPEFLKVLAVARGTVHHVLPLCIAFDGVVQFGGACSEFEQAVGARASLPLSVGVCP